MRVKGLLAGLFTLAAVNAHAEDPVYLCAYENGEQARILRVTVTSNAVDWVQGGNAYFKAAIVDNSDGRIIAVSGTTGGLFTADLFLLDVSPASHRFGFVWSRASMEGQSATKRGECEKAG